MYREVTVVIPNFNGMSFLPDCINSLRAQSFRDFDILVVDNASTDGSREWLSSNGIDFIAPKSNLGFAGGVNLGIKLAKSSYVILLNNDTEVLDGFVENLLKAIKKSSGIFSVSAMMISAKDKELIDDAGDGLSIIGFGYQRGVGERISSYTKRAEVFSACAGAAIYDVKILKKIGLFDEAHFAYLEDIDLGYRARLQGYKNLYEPSARVYHLGSATSGSKYNSFKVRLSARNNIYLFYKNQSNIQLLINILPLTLGILVKMAFFYKKGFLKDYLAGLREGFSKLGTCKRQNFSKIKLIRFVDIEIRLIMGLFEFISHFLKRRLIKRKG